MGNTHKSEWNGTVWFVTVFIGDMVDILGSRPLLVSVSFIIMEDQVADDDSLERQAKKIAILEKNLSKSEHFKLSTNRYEY